MDSKATAETVGAVNPITRGEAAHRSARMSEQKPSGHVGEQVEAMGELFSSLHAKVRDLALLDKGSDAERLTKLKDVLFGALDEIDEITADEALRGARIEAYGATVDLKTEIVEAIGRLTALHARLEELETHKIEDVHTLYAVALALKPGGKELEELSRDELSMSLTSCQSEFGSFIGAAIADAEESVDWIEDEIAKRSKPAEGEVSQ